MFFVSPRQSTPRTPKGNKKAANKYQRGSCFDSFFDDILEWFPTLPPLWLKNKVLKRSTLASGQESEAFALVYLLAWLSYLRHLVSAVATLRHPRERRRVVLAAKCPVEQVFIDISRKLDELLNEFDLILRCVSADHKLRLSRLEALLVCIPVAGPSVDEVLNEMFEKNHTT